MRSLCFAVALDPDTPALLGLWTFVFQSFEALTWRCETSCRRYLKFGAESCWLLRSHRPAAAKYVEQDRIRQQGNSLRRSPNKIRH